MIDKQQLQAMGEHQAEQHMCMAKQIEDLQARLQECANGAAKMQEQRDAVYVMAGKSGLERDKFAQQLKAANQQIAAMAELLRRCKPYIDDQKDWGREYEKKLSTDIESALSGNLPDHVAGSGEVGLSGWLLSKLPQADDEEKNGGWKLSVDFLSCVRSKTFEKGWGVGEEEIETVLTLVDSMLAAAPKLEQTK